MYPVNGFTQGDAYGNRQFRALNVLKDCRDRRGVGHTQGTAPRFLEVEYVAASAESRFGLSDVSYAYQQARGV